MEQVLVERFDADHPADLMVCDWCYTEWRADPTILDDGMTRCPNTTICSGHGWFKYAEADPCRSCGELGYWHAEVDRCCSRACQLQWQYAEQLRVMRRAARPL